MVTAGARLDAAAVAARAVAAHGADQDPWELARVLDILAARVRPAVVVEIGSWRGGTLAAWAALGALTWAVTRWEPAVGAIGGHGATVIYGDSTDPATRAALAAAMGGLHAGFVWIDGGHDEATCAADLEWALALAPGGVIGIHDIHTHRRHPGIGVHRVWEAAAARFPHMTIAADPATSPGTGLLWAG